MKYFTSPFVTAWIFTTLMSTAFSSGVQNDLGIQVIPRPIRVETTPGYFFLNTKTRIGYVNTETEGQATLLKNYLKQDTVKLKSFKKGTRYEIRASVRSEGGQDSVGVITLRRN